MKYVKMGSIFIGQLLILWLLHEAGGLIARYLKLPIPGSVIGMVLLFILLSTGILKLKWIDLASSFLLKHLIFFFIPITVGIMTLGPIFLQHGIPFLVILLTSGVIGMVVTGHLTQFIANRKEG